MSDDIIDLHKWKCIVNIEIICVCTCITLQWKYFVLRLDIKRPYNSVIFKLNERCIYSHFIYIKSFFFYLYVNKHNIMLWKKNVTNLCDTNIKWLSSEKHVQHFQYTVQAIDKFRNKFRQSCKQSVTYQLRHITCWLGCQAASKCSSISLSVVVDEML